MAIGDSGRQKGSRALVTKKRGALPVPQFDVLPDMGDDDDEPTMVHTALFDHGRGLMQQPEPEPEAEPEAAAEEWHFQISVGPEELLQLAERGLISNETLAWRPGLTEWKRVDEIPQLEERLTALPNGSLLPPRAPRFDGFPEPGSDHHATTPFASPEPMSDTRRAPTTPPQARGASSPGGRPLSVLPPPPVPPKVGSRRPGATSQNLPTPPLAYAHSLRPGDAAGAAQSAAPLWDMPADPAAMAAGDDAVAFRSGRLQALRAPAQWLATARNRLGSRGQKIALAASAILVLGAGTWIASAAYGGGTARVDNALHTAARPALEAAVKQSTARATPPPAEPEPEPAPAAAAPAAEPEPTSAAEEAKAADESTPKPAAPSAAAVSKAAAEPKGAAQPEPAPTPAAKGFDAAAANRAVDRAAGAASSCVDEGARVPGSITLTFAPTGKVKSAKLGRALSSPALERCVVGAFRRASVPAFSGGDGTVTKSFRLKG
jgi:hypothetical protein